jgi:tRNA splicing endonuclease
MDEKLYFENDDMLSVRSSKLKSFCSLGKFDINLSEIQKMKKNNNIKIFTLNQNNNINKLIPNIMNLIPFINNIKTDDNISALKTSLTISSNNINLEESFRSIIPNKPNDSSKRINLILYSSLNNLEQKRHYNTKKNSKCFSNKSNSLYNNIISNYKFRLNSKRQNNNENSFDSNSSINQKFAYYNNNYNNKTLDISESSSSYIKFNTYIPKKKIEQNSIINQNITNKSYYKNNEKNNGKIYIKKKIQNYDMNSNNRSNIDNSYLTQNSKLTNRNKTPDIRIKNQNKRKNISFNRSFDNKDKIIKRNTKMDNKKNEIDTTFNSDRVIFNNIRYNK